MVLMNLFAGPGVETQTENRLWTQWGQGRVG